MSKLNLRSYELFSRTGANPGNNYKPQYNGDTYVNFVNDYGIRIFAVIDGAKAPFDYDVDGKPSDAFAAETFATLIEENFAAIAKPSNWKSALKTCITSYQLSFDTIRCILPQYQNEDYRLFNGACAFTMAIIDENNGDCIVLNATDCYMCVRKNGKVVNLSAYDEQAMLNSGLLERSVLLNDWIAQGKTLAEATALEHQRVLTNRKRVYNKCTGGRNQLGMAVMNGDIALLDCIQTDSFNIHNEDIDAFIGMSDGYMCKHDDIVLCAKGALTKGPEPFFQKQILPKWGKHVMTDITCAVFKY